MAGEIVDRETNIDQKQKPILSLLYTLAFIGNGIWLFLFVILFVACLFNGADLMKTTSLDQVFGGLVGFFIVLSFVMILTCIACWIGLKQLKRNKKQGFFLYASGNVLWSVVLLYASEGSMLYVLPAIVSLGFVGGFGWLQYGGK